MLLVKIHEKLHICPAPGIDRLIRIAHDEEISVIPAQRLHQLILQAVDILKLVDHDIFEPLLPFEPDIRILAENIQGKFDQIVVVEPEALFRLVEIPVEDHILRPGGPHIFVVQGFQRKADQVKEVLRFLKELLNLDHVAGIGEGHIPQRKAALLIDDAQHVVNVGIVQDKKALRVADGIAVLLQNGHAEAVEGIDVPGIVIPGQCMDALAHLIGGLVGKGHAQNIPRQDTELVYKIGEAVGQRAGLAGTGPGDDAYKALCRCDCLKLGGIEKRFAHTITSIMHLDSFSIGQNITVEQKTSTPIPRRKSGYMISVHHISCRTLEKGGLLR